MKAKGGDMGIEKFEVMDVIKIPSTPPFQIWREQIVRYQKCHRCFCRLPGGRAQWEIHQKDCERNLLREKI
jgi:hypothetical protein